MIIAGTGHRPSKLSTLDSLPRKAIVLADDTVVRIPHTLDVEDDDVRWALITEELNEHS